MALPALPNMKLVSSQKANATNLNRKSGGAKWRACPERSRMGICGSLDSTESLLEMIFDRARRRFVAKIRGQTGLALCKIARFVARRDWRFAKSKAS
jgi:hypothetical protein